MPAGTTLAELVLMLREETGRSTLASHGQNETSSLQRKIRRTQYALWLEHDWPSLQVIKYEDPIDIGQSAYALPDGIELEGINEVAVYYNGDWTPVIYGIDLGHLNAYDPEQGEGSAPILRWEMDAGIGPRGYRIWPMPNEAGMRLRFKGQRSLAPLVANEDTCDLDDELIVMTAAAEILERQGSKDAARVAAVANRMLGKLRARGTRNPVTHMAAGALGAPSAQPRRILRGGRDVG